MTDESKTDLADRVAAALSGQYEVTLELGRGGMAVVYLARDLRHDRFVALKVFRPDIASAVGSERFLLEIKTAAALEHPHILTLIDSGVADSLLYYVMPYIEGESLRQKIAREKQLGLDDTVRLTRHIASALDYAHRHGVIHRDIKPENILLHEESALVADFGIALAMGIAGSGRLTETGFALGTPQYMSPEQAAGDRELDSRSDTYALGCLVYEMLTGEPPPYRRHCTGRLLKDDDRGANADTRDSQQRPRAHGSRGGTLAKVPADRFATPLGFVEALTDPDRPITGPRSHTRSSITSTSNASRTRRTIGFLGIGLAAAFIGVAWYANWARSSTTASATPTTQQVTFSGDARAVSLAPDGEMFAYLTEDGRAMVLRDVGGDVELRLAESTEPLGPPVWSSDGSTLLFAGNPGGGRGLYTISRLGGNSSLIAAGLVESPGPPGAAQTYDFAASDTAYAIAFSGAKIYLGSEPAGITRVTRDSFSITSGALIDLGEYVARVRAIDVSPDGAWVVFVGTTSDQQVLLGTVAVDGSSVNILAQADGIYWGASETFGSPQWSGAGNTMFYSQHSGSGSNILAATLVPRTGMQRGEPLLVAPSLPAEITFGAAPDQSRIVYAGGTSRTHLVLFSRDAAGSERLTTGTWHYHSLAAVLIFSPRVILTGDDEPERVLSKRVSYNFFSTLGTSPQIGRAFLPEEELTSATNVVVLSDG
ncbi:protein kinase, partial [Gemmatimonadota bacterium]